MSRPHKECDLPPRRAVCAHPVAVYRGRDQSRLYVPQRRAVSPAVATATGLEIAGLAVDGGERRR